MDDLIGGNTPRGQFINFLRENITDVICWIIPVKSDGNRTTEEVIERLVAKAKIKALCERTHSRKHLKLCNS